MRRTILLVDDERDVLEPMRILLEEEYRVCVADSGREALEILEREPVEVIIADQRMPGMTGVELLQCVREMDPEIVRLVLSAYTDFEAMLDAINQGQVYRYIIKPWDPGDMLLTIRQALEWKDLRARYGQQTADLEMVRRELAERNKELDRAHRTILKQEKLAALGLFAAEVGHEMSNQLQILSLVKDKLLDATQEHLEGLSELEYQVSSLTSLVTTIRDFSLGAALPFSPSLTDPLAPATDTIRLCKSHPDFKKVNVLLEHDKPDLWSFDANQLRHVLFNLLKNAARHSPDSAAIKVRVTVENGHLVYRVMDHGPGVSRDLREQVFEPFFSRTEGGTGLGLAVSKQIVETHGGTISCEETPGGGCTMVIRLPKK